MDGNSVADKEIKGQLASRGDSVCYRFYSSLVTPSQRANSHPNRVSKLSAVFMGICTTQFISPRGYESYNGGRATVPSTRLEGNIRCNNRLPASERKRNHRGREIRCARARARTSHTRARTRYVTCADRPKLERTRCVIEIR